MSINASIDTHPYLSDEQRGALQQQGLAHQGNAIVYFSEIISTLGVPEASADQVMTAFSEFVSNLDHAASAEVASRVSELKASIGSAAVLLFEQSILAGPANEPNTGSFRLPEPEVPPNGNGHHPNGAQKERLSVTESFSPGANHGTDPDARTQEATAMNGAEADKVIASSEAAAEEQACDKPSSSESTADAPLSAIGVNMLVELFGEDKRNVLASLNRSQAAEFIFKIVDRTTREYKRTSNSSAVIRDRADQFTLRALEGKSWRKISDIYGLSNAAVGSNFKNFKNLLNNSTASFRDELISSILPGSAETKVPASTQTAPTENKEPEPIVEEPAELLTEDEPPKSEGEHEHNEVQQTTVRANLDRTLGKDDLEKIKKAAIDKLCTMLHYNSKDQHKVMSTIFSMRISQPVYSNEARAMYTDLSDILKLTTSNKYWPVVPEAELEVKVLNSILHGAADNKSPLAPQSVKGILSKELAEASRKFEEVLSSALHRFATVREEILG